MKRKIIEIDRELCDGCGLCAAAFLEGAIGMAGGKAVKKIALAVKNGDLKVKMG
jgi:ferredoxin